MFTTAQKGRQVCASVCWKPYRYSVAGGKVRRRCLWAI